METMGLLVLGVLAQWTPLLAAPVMYELVNKRVTWSEGLSYCREHFFDLAIVGSQEQWDTFKELLRSTGTERAWIGLYDDNVDVWKWSMLKQPVTTAAESWFTASLSNYGGRLACGYLRQGTLYDASCSSTYKSVCYDERFDSYIPVTVPMTWYDAQRYCRESHTDLSSIRNQQEKNDIMSVIDSSEWWVGLFRHTWIWTGGSISPFRDWVSGEPNQWYEQCTAALENGWIDVRCGSVMPFICSVGRRMKMVNVWLKTPASVNLSDPKILEDLAIQMQNHMMSQNILQPFKMTWRKNVQGDVFSGASTV